MKLKYETIFQPLGDFWLAVPVGEAAKNFANYIRLNRSSYIIVSSLVEETDEESLVKRFMDEYDVDESIARRDVRTIIEWLRSASFLLEDNIAEASNPAEGIVAPAEGQ